MVTTALDTMSTNTLNCITDAGEKLLKRLAEKGRIFVVNDAEKVRHTVMYDGGEPTTFYKPDLLTTESPAQYTNNLDDDPKEFLTQAHFDMQAATRNINMPQSQPAGNMIDYASSLVNANMMEIFNQEEKLFWLGSATAASDADPVKVDPSALAGDTDTVNGLPMSCLSLLTAGDSTINGISAGEKFAGIAPEGSSAISRWAAHYNNDPTDPTPSDNTAFSLSTDLQKAIINSTYSERERPTHVFTSIAMFEVFLQQLRGGGALPDPVRANLGSDTTVPFGGVSVDFSRYIDPSENWATNPSASPTADNTPIIGLNLNSLRLNLVRQGSVSGDKIGWINQIGPGILPHPKLPVVFKRIEWKRCYSVDNGRRSNFLITGYTAP